MKVSLLLSVIKPLHAKWIADLHDHSKADKEMIVNGFGFGSELLEYLKLLKILRISLRKRNFSFFRFFILVFLTFSLCN